MNRILVAGVALATGLLIQLPAEAQHGRGGSAGLTRGGGAPARSFSGGAPARSFSGGAPARSFAGAAPGRSFSSGGISRAPALQARPAPVVRSTQPTYAGSVTRTPSSVARVPQTRGTFTTPGYAGTRRFAGSGVRRGNPSIAFGGSTTRSSVRPDLPSPQYARAPYAASRGWDRGRIHTWNNHRYRWANNSWVIVNGDYGYGYPYYGYGYGYGAPVYSYSYDDDPDYVESYSTPAATAEPYASSGNLAADVQTELTREGYDTGGVDGVIGPMTRNAISDFQRDKGLPVTGRIDRSLLQALGLS